LEASLADIGTPLVISILFPRSIPLPILQVDPLWYFAAAYGLLATWLTGAREREQEERKEVRCPQTPLR
jgi:hypothetical protein